MSVNDNAPSHKQNTKIRQSCVSGAIRKAFVPAHKSKPNRQVLRWEVLPNAALTHFLTYNAHEFTNTTDPDWRGRPLPCVCRPSPSPSVLGFQSRYNFIFALVEGMAHPHPLPPPNRVLNALVISINECLQFCNFSMVRHSTKRTALQLNRLHSVYLN